MIQSALPFDDPAWASLPTREGDGSWVPKWLTELSRDPADAAHFADGWPALCSEGTTWPAAIAAFPHLVRIAESLPPGARFEYVTVFGLIAADWEPGSDPLFAVPDTVESAYRAALARALELAAAESAFPIGNERDLRYLLMSFAALHNVPELARCLDDLDDDETCPRYAAHVWGEDAPM
ncbi:hypothetical protein EGT67_00360 [Prescottella agglutinans]|uniref:Uncharacterized protein n=1 Tax=Prescottella agglutinans TaxID=1644129 RepID=A0A3S3D1P8_9NOCA|nr:hypothetical protein [Prescottella agglutinans]RVW10968.1 hypothetical protein EGT67_00360 [Prescottella agglutinans]